MIRYDDMRIDRLLLKEYQQQMAEDVNAISGLNDIEELLKAFERKFAEYIGTKFAVAVNSGSDALQLALLTLGVGKGDYVLVPNLTYPAVALSVLYVGAKPIFVDAGKDLQIDAKLLASKVRKNTKAVIAAHMFARPCAIESIMELACCKGWKVIEDCCQAESSTLKGKKLGSFADMSCFSFSYYKPLSSCGGGGGMVCFSDEEYRRVVDYTRMGDYEELINAGKRFSRMSLLDLAAVKVKWQYLKEIVKSRLQINALYGQALVDCKGLRIIVDSADSVSVAQNFVIMHPRRDDLGEVLNKSGIVWQKPYVPLSRMKIFQELGKDRYPESDAYFEQAIHLPLYSFMKKDAAEKTIELVKEFCSRHGN